MRLDPEYGSALKDTNMNSFEEIRCLDVPLADKLTAYADQLGDTEPHITRAYSALVDRLLAADAGSLAPATGSTLPAFLLPDNEGRLIGSTELMHSGPLVVSFNRGHWCSFCRLELLALSEIHPKIKQLGGAVVSIVPEIGSSTKRLRETLDIPFQILTDIDNGYALNCGLMVSLGDAVREVFLDIGTDLAEHQGNDAWFVPIPATFVIGTDGRINGRFIDPDFRHRMAPDDILNCLKETG